MKNFSHNPFSKFIKVKLRLAFFAILLISSSIIQTTFAQIIPPVMFGVRVEILKVVANSDPDGISGGVGDYYANVEIDNRGEQKSPVVSGGGDIIVEPPYTITPNWKFEEYYTLDQIDYEHYIPIRIVLIDDDGTFGGRDDIDINPQIGKHFLDLDYLISEQTWIGDSENKIAGKAVTSSGPLDGTFEAEGSALIEFRITTFVVDDIDQDGIPDEVELGNYAFKNAKGEDTTFKTLGADPCRSTIAVEIDYMETHGSGAHSHAFLREGQERVKTMFDEAPVSSVINCPYAGFPIKTTGINLILDNSSNPVVKADGTPMIEQSTTSFSDSDSQFNQIKKDNFDPRKKPFFHYALLVHRVQEKDGPPLDITGRGELLGNDFIVSKGDNFDQISLGYTFAHELGHNLNLQHGGYQEINCKPNYLSIMSYMFNRGIKTGTDESGSLPKMDYSRVELPLLHESHLNERKGIQGMDGRLFTGWRDSSGMAHSAPANSELNWNGNLNSMGNDIIDTDLVNVDINHRDGELSNDKYVESGDNCKVANPDQNYTGYDDWNNLKYIFATDSDYLDDVDRKDLPIEITEEESREFEQFWDETLANPDLEVSQEVNLLNATPGDILVYEVTIDNIGEGRATNVKLTDRLPNGTETSRDMGFIQPHETKTVTFTYKIPFPIEDKTILSNKVSVTGVGPHDQPDANFNNNINSISTTVNTPVLQISKSSQENVKNCEAIYYKIIYQNVGSGIARNIVIYDTLASDIFYSKELDIGAGPKPDIIQNNQNGTTTLIWRIPELSSQSSQNLIDFTARTTLLSDSKSVTNHAIIDFSDKNGNNYNTKDTFKKTGLAEIKPTKNPKNIVYWQSHKELWTKETLARIQVTDQRFDSTKDGVLSSAEVNTMLKSFYSGRTFDMLKAQLLITYLNLASYRITDDTKVYSPLTTLLKIKDVGDAINYSIFAINNPKSSQFSQYYALVILYQINSNHIEVYSPEGYYSFPFL